MTWRPIRRRWTIVSGLTIVLLLALVVVSEQAVAPVVNRGDAVTRTRLATQTPAAAQSVATATATPNPLPNGQDWTQYRADVQGTGVNPEGVITSSNVGALAQQWSISRSQGFYSTPAIVNGTIYITTGASLFAMDLVSGVTLWHFDVPNEQRGGIHSSVAVDPAKQLAFFGTPEARLYAVATTTGKQKWQIQLADPSVGSYIWSSPLVANDKVYVGIASQGDNPCVRGAAVALNEEAGQQAWIHYMVGAGSLGGSVWSSMTADPDDHEVIATTGNPCPLGPVSEESDAIVALDWNTGATRWKYTAIADDTHDFDFGEGAVNFTYAQQQYVVAGNKFGKVYAVTPRPDGTARLVWSAQLAISDNGRDGGGIFQPPAYANGVLTFAGGPPPDKSCGLGSLQAFQPNTGKVLWKVCMDGRATGPAAISGDVIFMPQDHKIAAYNMTTGQPLWTASRKGPAWGGVAISHGAVVAGTVPGMLSCYRLPMGDA